MQTLLVNMARIPNKNLYSEIHFLTFSISAYKEQKFLPYSLTKGILSMTKNERRFAKQGSSSTLALNFFDIAISRQIKT